MRHAPRSPSLTLPPPHVFDQGNPAAERNTRWAVLLTVVVMVAEIIGGVLFNSMALLADGWHMSSHALALGLSLLAYAAARRFARDGRFTFGTWKIEVLGGYTSALCLVGVAGLMLYHSVQRLFAPVPIHYNQAILLAILGLAVNLVCAVLLRDSPDHHHGHEHHGHGDDEPDRQSVDQRLGPPARLDARAHSCRKSKSRQYSPAHTWQGPPPIWLCLLFRVARGTPGPENPPQTPKGPHFHNCPQIPTKF